MKSTMAELTDETNIAQAFSLMPVVYSYVPPLSKHNVQALISPSLAPAQHLRKDPLGQLL